MNESLRSDELTIFCAYRVWRSTLILSIASCYLMWGKSGLSLALCYPLFLISSNLGDAVYAIFSKGSQIPLSPPLSLSQSTNPLLFLTHSQHKPAHSNPLLIPSYIAITFLSQWHPLIQPKMNAFRSWADWSGA